MIELCLRTWSAILHIHVKENRDNRLIVTSKLPWSWQDDLILGRLLGRFLTEWDLLPFTEEYCAYCLQVLQSIPPTCHSNFFLGFLAHTQREREKQAHEGRERGGEGGGGIPVTSPAFAPGLVMSCILDRLLSFLLREFKRMKYFCAWLATYKTLQFATTWVYSSRLSFSKRDSALKTVQLLVQKTVLVLERKPNYISWHPENKLLPLLMSVK